MDVAPVVAVVVVGYGSSTLLAEEHFVTLTAADSVQMVVVDAWSGEDERRAVTDLAQRRGWQLVALDQNPGFGAGVNRGVEHARRTLAPDVVLVLNPDAVMRPADLDTLVRTVTTTPWSLVCPVVEDEHGTVWFGGGEVLVRQGRVRTRGVDVRRVPEPWVTGACLAFAPALWERLGGFDERYFMYWEDVDLSWRARRMGATVVVEDRARVTHLVGATQGADGKSDLYRRYNARNRLLFASLHLGRRDLCAWVVRTPRFGWTILVRGGRRHVLSRPVGVTWSVLRGSLEGLAQVVRRPRRWTVGVDA